MALILAIEPDHRQAAQLAGIARHRLSADLILADTTEHALDAIGDRIPDLVLIPALLSPQDDAALAAALRVIAAAANVRTLTIPVFAAAAPPREEGRGMLGRWRRGRASPAPDGCDPAVFAEQISTYLVEAVAERQALAPEPAFDEPVIESAHITAGFIVEPPPAVIEPALAQYEPISATMSEAVFDDVPVVAEAPVFEAPALPFESAAFESAAFESADVIEIDLSEETLEHTLDVEPVFEISLEEIPGAFAEAPTTVQLDRAVEDAGAFRGRVSVQTPVPAPFAAPLPDDDFAPLARPASNLELWMPLSFGAARLWPAIEGVASEYVDLSAELFSAPAPAKSEHPEWTELIASLRQDLERRRDPVEPTPITRAVPRRKTKPVQDEWGFFDPQQCGFAALLAKLDEITDASDEPASRLA